MGYRDIELLAKSLSGMLPEVVNVLDNGVEKSILTGEFPDMLNQNYALNPAGSDGRNGAILTKDRNGEIATVTGSHGDAVQLDMPDQTAKKYELPVTFEYFPITDNQIRALNSVNKASARQALDEIAQEGVNRQIRLSNRMKSQALFNEGVVANDTNDPVIYNEDWGIPAGNLETLLTTARWGQVDDDPTQDIIDISQAVLNESGMSVNKLFSDAALPMTFITRAQLSQVYGEAISVDFIMNRKLHLPGLGMVWDMVDGQYTNRAGAATNYATSNRLVLIASNPGNPVGKMEWGTPRGLENLGMTNGSMTTHNDKKIAIWAVPNQSMTGIDVYISAAMMAVLKKPKQVAVIRTA